MSCSKGGDCSSVWAHNSVKPGFGLTATANKERLGMQGHVFGG